MVGGKAKAAAAAAAQLSNLATLSLWMGIANEMEQSWYYSIEVAAAVHEEMTKINFVSK